MTELPDKVDEGLLSRVQELMTAWAKETYAKDNTDESRRVYGSCLEDVLSQVHMARADEYFPLMESLASYVGYWTMLKARYAGESDEGKATYIFCSEQLAKVIND